MHVVGVNVSDKYMLDNIIKNIIKYKSIKIVNFYPKHISWSYNTKSNSIMSYFIQHTIYKNNRNVFVINEPCIEITTESFKNLKKNGCRILYS